MQDWKSVGLEECRQDWKSVRLEGCRIGMCHFMDYIGSIIFGIFIICFGRYSNMFQILNRINVDVEFSTIFNSPFLHMHEQLYFDAISINSCDF